MTRSSGRLLLTQPSRIQRHAQIVRPPGGGGAPRQKAASDGLLLARWRSGNSPGSYPGDRGFESLLRNHFLLM